MKNRGLDGAKALGLAVFGSIILIAGGCGKNSETASLSSETSFASKTTISETTTLETTTPETITSETAAPASETTTVSVSETPATPFTTTILTSAAPVSAQAVTATSAQATAAVQASADTSASTSQTAETTVGTDVIWLNKDTCVSANTPLKLRFGGRSQADMLTIYDAVYHLFYPYEGHEELGTWWDSLVQKSTLFGGEYKRWQDIDVNSDDDLIIVYKFCAYFDALSASYASGPELNNAARILGPFSHKYFQQAQVGNCSTAANTIRAIMNWFGYTTRYIGGYPVGGTPQSTGRHAMVQIKRADGHWETVGANRSETFNKYDGGDNVLGQQVYGYIIDYVEN